MSIRAMNWAMEQATGDPRAQCLLYVVADTANEEGVAWPGADWMAKKSQQSRATVYRRLANLQELGLLVMFPRWIDDDGKIWNAAAPGRRRTSPEIRLQFGVFIKQDDPPNDDGEGPESSAPLSQVETTPVSGSDGPISPARQGSSHCSDDNHHLNRQEDSPPCPPSGGLGLQSNDCEGWEEFKSAFEVDGEPIIRVSIAKQLFDALSPDERKRVTKAAKGLITFRAKQKKPAAKPSAQTFIREIDAWPTWAAHAPSEAKPLVKAAIARDAPAWQGLCIIKRIWSAPDPGNGVEVQEGAIPYLESLAGLFEFIGPWRVIRIRDDHKQAKAWEERIGRCGFRMPASQRLKLLEEGARDAEGRTTRLARYLEGWLLPLEWPPRMDGTLSTTGPPTQSLMRGDDDEVLAEELDRQR